MHGWSGNHHRQYEHHVPSWNINPYPWWEPHYYPHYYSHPHPHHHW